MDKYLILMTGFPGTGKTNSSKALSEKLENYELISQNTVMRNFGVKKMPKTQENVLRTIDKMTMNYLSNGKGVIIDSINRHTFRRQQLYGIASGCGKNVVVIECVCSEEEAKKRMRNRPYSDGFVSDPNDPAVWDKTARYWESVEIDFKYPGVDFVSHLVFDTEKETIDKKIVRPGLKRFISKIEKILL